MALKQTYAIWNNKGGVGKSTIAFHLATTYADKNPDDNVLVVDLCPQANASMMLLGGGTAGEAAVLDLCKSSTPKTVVGYLGNVIAAGPGATLPKPRDWLVRAQSHNKHVANNLYLLCGDGNLEPMAPLISDRAAAPALTPTSDPWKWVHLVIRSFIEDLATRQNKNNWMVFIDTNPSFSIYTEIGISAASKLIVPVNADDSSRVAINALFTLLHGSTPIHPIYGRYTFAAKAAEKHVSIPQVHLIVGNRLTQHEGPATAFEAMTEATAESLYDAYKANPLRFSPLGKSAANQKRFTESYSVPLRDFNTAGVVAAHLGRPLSKLPAGYYKVHGTDVNVDGRRVKECSDAIDEVLKRL